MNYNVFEQNFPVLVGPTIIMREIRKEDTVALFPILNEPEVEENYGIVGYLNTQEKLWHNCGVCAKANYEARKQIQWVIEEQATGAVVGIRDLFVDNDAKPLTVQGFTGKKFRRKGFSEEAYRLILAYTREKGATGLMANTGIENFPAIALLFSVGFKPHYISPTEDSLRIVYVNDYEFDDDFLFEDKDIKRLYLFCKMYLHASEIDITEDLPIGRDGMMRKGYRVKLTAHKKVGGPSSNVTGKLDFLSDGVVILSRDKNEPHVSFLDGRTKYYNAWNFCWLTCRVA